MKVRNVAAAMMAISVLFGTVSVVKAGQGPKDINSIVDLALTVNGESGEFSTLIAAVVATGLDAVLDGKGQYTVFAPTDAAFATAGLTAEIVDEMTSDELDALAGILLYHVKKGRLLSGDVVAADQIRTASKQFLTVTVNDEGVFVNESKILIEEELFDLEVDNGVVHVIDAVLLP